MRDRKCHTVEGVADQGKVEFARKQRRQPTATEEVLWRALRDCKLGVKFRRQHPIGAFVLDFYCAEMRLAVEVDGGYHAAQRGHERWRDGVVADSGIRVLRISDELVRTGLAAVVKEIRRALESAEEVSSGR